MRWLLQIERWWRRLWCLHLVWKPRLVSRQAMQVCEDCGHSVWLTDEEFYARFGELYARAVKERAKFKETE